jgi:hypothetical protein
VDSRDRVFPRVISPQWLARTDVRAQFLAAMHAMVMNWARHEARPLHPKPLPTFEDWTSAIGALVIMAGYADPLTAPDLTVSGDTEGDEFKALLIKVASENEENTSVDRKTLVDKARELGLLEGLVGIAGGKDLDDKANIKFGRRLQRWRGRELRDEQGRRFQFGHKRQKSGMTYPLTFL